jgi:hypothetical protein
MVREDKRMIRLLSRGRLVRGLVGAALVTGAAMPALAQTAGDIVVIGNSPNAWGRNQSHWNQLMGLSRPKPSAVPPAGAGAPAPAVDVKALAANVRVSELRLEPIIGLSGSSLVMGTVTNGNRQPVTVTAVNFKVFDAQGKLLQTGTAVPRPATIGPGQSVTIQQQLPTVPADSGAKVQLYDPAVTIEAPAAPL